MARLHLFDCSPKRSTLHDKFAAARSGRRLRLVSACYFALSDRLMPEESEPPQPPLPEQPTLLGNLAPEEMFARGMQSVKMTSGTAGTWQPPALEEAARLFPGYAVIKLLGRGGMGAVYQARQIELDRLVAIKLLPLEISVDKDFAERFRREARAMAKLHHPNIVTVFDFGTTHEGHLYFAMEYVEGANLNDIIHRNKQGEASGLDAGQALAIVEQVCTALAYAHDKGIVHRDIKPANVLIDTERHVKVADFGLARLTDASTGDLGHTMTGTVMGTPDYMAPEQTRGLNVDHRADIYSLGVMLYEMLCREVPKGFFDPPSQRTGCDTRIDAIVIKAIHQSPDRRYQSTQDMKADITSARTPLPAAPPTARPGSAQATAARRGGEGGTKIGTGFGLALVILLTIGVVTYRNSDKLTLTAEWVEHTHVVLQDLEGVLSAVGDADTGQRGYLLTGDERYLEPYNASIIAVHQKLADLRKLTADNANQQRRLDALGPLTESRFAELKETIDLRKDQTKGFEAALKAVKASQGKRIMDEMRKVVAEMESEEQNLLKTRSEEAQASARNARLTIVFGTLSAFIVTAVAGFVIIRRRMRAPRRQTRNPPRRRRAGA